MAAWPTPAFRQFKEENVMPLSLSVACRPRNLLLTALLVPGSMLATTLLSDAWAATPKTARTLTPSGNGYIAQTNGGHVAIVLSRDARQVTRAFIAYTYKCSDGTSFTDFESFRAIPLLSNRTFKSSYDSGQLPSPIVPGASLKVTGSIDGQRNRRGTRVTGTARFTFVTTLATGEAVSCDTGTIQYRAND
jgi:hypothetical protein